ncbi:MAG: AAA family ATPase [Gammaproteobacteria bacterium]
MDECRYLRNVPDVEMKLPFNDNKYYLKFDLERDPFPLDSIDNILYLTPELNRRLERIKELIISSQKLLLVTSSPGAGKSTLSDHLTSLKENNWMVSLVKGDTGMDVDSLAHAIIQKLFPDKSFETSKSVNQLHKFLETSALNGKVPVFIIDDAHKLSVETLEFILQLSELRFQETLFRIVLFADETINDRFAESQLKTLITNVFHHLYIPSFSRKQIGEYLDCRLSLCGKFKEYPFADKDIDRIYRVSAGLPGGINYLARQIMQDYILTGIDRPRYGRIAVVSGVIIILFISVYSAFFDQQIKEKIAATTKKIPIPPALPEVNITAEKQLGKEEKVVEIYIATNNTKVTEQALASVEETQQPEKYTELNVGNQSITTRPIAPGPQGQVRVNNKPEIASRPQPEESHDQKQSTLVEPVEEGIEALVVELSKTNDEVEQIPAAPQEQVSASDDENVFHVEPVSELFSGIKGPGWFRRQPENSYVLQLISSREISNVKKLLKGQTGIRDQLSGYTNYTPSGKSRYLLFYGLYPDIKSAKEAVNRLPARFRSLTPWPRSIGHIVTALDRLVARGYQ